MWQNSGSLDHNIESINLFKINLNGIKCGVTDGSALDFTTLSHGRTLVNCLTISYVVEVVKQFYTINFFSSYYRIKFLS